MKDRHGNLILLGENTHCIKKNNLNAYVIKNIQKVYTEPKCDDKTAEFTMAYIQAYSRTLESHHVLLFYVRNSERFVLVDGQGYEWEMDNSHEKMV